MLVEKGLMKTEVVFNNESKTERYLLRKVWDEEKPLISLVMTNPSTANAVSIDMTVHYCIDNIYRLGDYGGVDILNMTSRVLPKIDTKSDVSLTDVNKERILKSAEKSDKVVIAWGKIGENNSRVKHVQLEVLELLKPLQSQGKLYMIASDRGDVLFHPLAAQVRFSWHLVPFVMPDYLQEGVGG